MPKSYDKFRYSDWDWIAIHFAPAEREDMAKTAWLIAQCSADEIAKHKNLNPRIIIPLCAVEFQDEINWEELKEKNFNPPQSFDDLDDDGVTANFRYIQHFKQQQSQETKSTQNLVSVVQTITDNKVLQNLFFSIEERLLLDLLKRLQLSHRRLSKNDWRNIYESEIKYNFNQSFHYRFILLFTIASIVFSLLAISSITLKEDNIFWINIVKGLTLYILITFWISSLQNSAYFIKYGLLGLLPFNKSKTYQWLSTKKIEASVDISNTVTEIVGGSLILPWALLLSQNSISLLTLVPAVTIFLSFASGAFGQYRAALGILSIGLVIFLFVLVPAINVPAINIWVAVTIFLSLASGAFSQYRAALGIFILSMLFCIITVIFGFFPLTEGEFISGIFIGLLLTLVRPILHKYANDKNYLRLLSIITFPFFCSFPILVIFATMFLLRYFSWQSTLFIWLISLGTCIGLWLYGKDKERKATNPLKGILPNN